MKFISHLLIASALMVHLTCSAEEPQTQHESTKQIELALETYIKEGPVAGVQAWQKGSPAKGSNEGIQQEAFVRQFEALYGKAEGFEILNRHTLSARTRLVAFVINHKRGALFGRIQFYQVSSGEWVPMGVILHPESGQMFPGSMQPTR